MSIAFKNQQKCLELVFDIDGKALDDMQEYYQDITKKLGSGKMMSQEYNEYELFMEHKWSIVYQRLEAKYKGGMNGEARDNSF